MSCGGLSIGPSSKDVFQVGVDRQVVCRPSAKPLNVVMSAADPSLTAAEREAIGVKGLSVGGALSRLALAAFMKGARE